VDFCVVGADNGTFDRAGDDFLCAVIRGCVLDDTMTEQRPILHQTKHPNSLLERYCLHLTDVGNRGKGDRILELR
jgi:hypothetical protein